MPKCISIHSYKGGTGKTIIATNLAAILALKGFNVALLDLDLRAPSLYGTFASSVDSSYDCFLNTYLDGRCEAENSIIDISKKLGSKGRFFVGLANPDINAISAMANKSKAWEVSSVKRLFNLRKKLLTDLKVDYVLIDTSPGVQYNSINAIVSSDLSIVITTNDSVDLQGTSSMLHELYEQFDRKAVILVNKVFPNQKSQFTDFKVTATQKAEKILGHRIMSIIPCYCEILEGDRSKIIAIEKPSHPFVKDLEVVIQKLDNLSTDQFSSEMELVETGGK